MAIETQKPRTPVVQTALRPRIPTQAEKEVTRGFTKRVTVACLLGMFALAGYGVVTANPDTADIVTALGPWAVALLSVYVAVGYGDHRLSKGLPSLTDILAIAFALRGSGSHVG